MTSVNRDPALIVVQLTGGNDYMNTVVPYGDPRYRDNRPTVGVAEADVLPVDGRYGFNPALAPLKEMYDAGRVAVRRRLRSRHARSAKATAPAQRRRRRPARRRKPSC